MNVNNELSDDSLRVLNSAAGPGYVPLRRVSKESDGRWLDGQSIKKGDCIIYKGEVLIFNKIFRLIL